MTPQEKQNLLDKIQRDTYARELRLRKEAAEHGENYEELRKMQPRHTLVDALNKLSVKNSIGGKDFFMEMQAMREKTQRQESPAFAEAAKGVTFYTADSRGAPQFEGHSSFEQSAEWYSTTRTGAVDPEFERQESWETQPPARPGKPNATVNTVRNTARTESPGFTPELKARRENADGSVTTERYRPSGQVEDAASLEARVFEQIRQILGSRPSIGF